MSFRLEKVIHEHFIINKEHKQISTFTRLKKEAKKCLPLFEPRAGTTSLKRATTSPRVELCWSSDELKNGKSLIF